MEIVPFYRVAAYFGLGTKVLGNRLSRVIAGIRAYLAIVVSFVRLDRFEIDFGRRFEISAMHVLAGGMHSDAAYVYIHTYPIYCSINRHVRTCTLFVVCFIAHAGVGCLKKRKETRRHINRFAGIVSGCGHIMRAIATAKTATGITPDQRQ